MANEKVLDGNELPKQAEVYKKISHQLHKVQTEVSTLSYLHETPNAKLRLQEAAELINKAGMIIFLVAPDRKEGSSCESQQQAHRKPS